MLCLHCALESSAHFVDAQTHTMGRRRILRMRMSKCSVKFSPKLSEASIVRRRIAAKASCPTPSLRSIGRPVCYIGSATHGALLLLVRSTFMCSPHSLSISTLRSGVERYLDKHQGLCIYAKISLTAVDEDHSYHTYDAVN